GLTLNHKHEHFIHAAMEGVIYNLDVVYLLLREVNGYEQITSLQATDGFARSELWRQMHVDIFNQVVILLENSESFCLGACILGLYALGKIDSFHIVQI